MKSFFNYRIIYVIVLSVICAYASDNDRWDSRFQFDGVDGDIDVLTANGNALYVGGAFVGAGSKLGANNIAKWDGYEWHALGDGLAGRVEAILVVGDDVYAGGWFKDAGGNADADYFARWDGQNWHGAKWNSVGTGLSNQVLSLTMFNGDLYAGGTFTDINGDENGKHVAHWDGAAWHAIGTGLSGGVNAIAITDSYIYAGGYIPYNISRWDGNNWMTVGDGLNGYVNAIVVNGENVYVGGNFTLAGSSVNAFRVAHWDGLEWHALGSGVNGLVKALGINQNSLYVGGNFTYAGDKGSARIAIWETDPTGIAENRQHHYPEDIILAQNYPNPFNSQTAIQYTLSEKSHVTLTTYNTNGQKIITMVNNVQLPGNYRLLWDGKNNSGMSIASGIYFYNLSFGNKTYTKKMILLQ